METHRTTAQIVAAAQAGDLACLDELVRRYQDPVYALAWSRLRDHHLAEDVAQATLVQAMVSLGSLRKAESLPSWLRRIALSQCGLVWRGKRHRSSSHEPMPEVAADQPSPSEQLEQDEAAADLRHALAALRPSDREILTLFYIQDLAIRDLADWLKVTPMAVKKRLHTARQRLKERMIQMMQNDVRRHLPSRNDQFARDVRQMLVQLCRDGLEKRFPGNDQAQQRWQEEARQLDEAVGQSFWQIAWQLVQFMRRQDIPCSPGGGRTPASLLAYLLGISRINPLEFGLSCARDPDPGRVYMSFTVCANRLDEVTRFIAETWPERVARFDRWPKELYRELYVLARPLRDMGIAAQAKDPHGLVLVSAEQCQRLRENGAIGVTLVGSRTITWIHAAMAHMAADGQEPPDLDHLDWDDPKPLQLLTDGTLDDQIDVLDWNFIVKRKLLQQLRPRRLADLAATLPLLCRANRQPEVMERYIRRRNGEAWVAPSLIVRDLLASTHGLLLYDEQFAELVSAATGWPTWSEQTWQLQDAVQRRIEPIVGQLRGNFLAAAREHGTSVSEAEAIWQVLLAGDPLYCKAAATGFAVTVFQAAWVRAYVPEAMVPGDTA
jgi:RNA polymerase sigma-70 factor (ECF subfamily)